jgi:hypothetical protein
VSRKKEFVKRKQLNTTWINAYNMYGDLCIYSKEDNAFNMLNFCLESFAWYSSSEKYISESSYWLFGTMPGL